MQIDNSVIIDVVRAALVKGGQHILIAPDGGVSIWPDTDATVVRCSECKKWVAVEDECVVSGVFVHTCLLTDMRTQPDDYCSYAEVSDDADGETPLSR